MTQNRYYSSTTKPTTVAADPGSTSTSLQVADSTVFASLDGKFPYTLAINWGKADQELVDVTDRPDGTHLTIARGQDGTAGISHAVGATVEHFMSGRDLNDAAAHRGASSGVHGLTGAVVGTTDTQVLSNKSTSDAFSVGGALSVTGAAMLSGGATITGNTSVSGNLSAGGIGKTIFLIKSADESVTSSTTLQDDNHLTTSVDANATYMVTGALGYEAGTTGDLALKWVAPSGASLAGIMSGLISSAASDLDNYASGLDAVNVKSVGGRGAGAARAMNFQGSLVVGGVAGAFKLQWAQLATDTVSTIVYKGSFMMLQRVA